MTSYHHRSDKLRLSFKNGEAELGYSNFALKELKKGTPRIGWIKLKNDQRDEKVRQRNLQKILLEQKKKM